MGVGWWWWGREEEVNKGLGRLKELSEDKKSGVWRCLIVVLEF